MTFNLELISKASFENENIGKERLPTKKNLLNMYIVI